MLWYATADHHPADVDDQRARAPWYNTKTEPSTADMIAKLRRVLIAAKYRPAHPSEPTPAEIHAILLAWGRRYRITAKVEVNVGHLNLAKTDAVEVGCRCGQPAVVAVQFPLSDYFCRGDVAMNAAAADILGIAR